MAPRIVGKKGRGPATPPPEPATTPAPEAAQPGSTSLMMAQERELRAKLKELRDHIVKNADNVGERFATEARAMHYGDKEHRPIYGEASPDEAKSLIDEGIEVSPLPTLPETGPPEILPSATFTVDVVCASQLPVFVTTVTCHRPS
jgi:hypothetical protein